MMMNGEENKPNETLEAIKAYFRGVKTEWGRITWPQRSQIVAETISVLLIVFIITVAIYVMDLVFKGVLSFIQ